VSGEEATVISAKSITERRTALNVEEARRVLALRERLRGWRPTQANRPWERPEHADRRLVVRRVP
jgi:hypothetical protein